METTKMSNTIPIEKLVGAENYATWEFSMKMILIHEDLWDCIQGTAEAVDTRKDQKALARICLSISSVIISMVRRAKTAKEAWDILKKAYQDTGLSRRLSLLRTLFNVKLQDQSMETYLNKIIDIAHQLHEIGSPLEDEFVAIITLSGLTPDYDPLIMALENSNIKLNSDIVRNKLLQESARRGVKEENNDNTSALSTVKKSTSYKCYKCKKAGHRIKECPMWKKKEAAENKKKDALLTALSANISSIDWYVDSGATNHMCNDQSIMEDFKNTTPTEVRVANGEKLSTAGCGNVNVIIDNCEKTISDVLYVPKLAANLLSVSSLVKKGYKVIFDSKGCKVVNKCNRTVASADANNGVYKLNASKGKNVYQSLCTGLGYGSVSQQVEDRTQESGEPGQAASLDSVTAEGTSQEVWHRRLGHLNLRSMDLLKKGMAKDIDYNINNFKSCVACVEGKQSEIPFPKRSQHRSTEVLGLVHSDLCGPMPVKSFSGATYYLTFIDDYTRKTYVYFLKSKSEVFENFKLFKREVENQMNKKIKVLRTDNGGEYVNIKFQSYLKENGIRHQTTIPHSPSQNGVAERANRTIMEKVRCMLQDAGLPKKFWAEAVNTAVYLKNRSPTKAVLGATPEEKWTGRKVSLKHIRIFGCLAYTKVTNRTKLDSKSKKCIFVGYCDESKGYRLIDPHTQKCIKSRNVTFMEDRFYSEKKDSNCNNIQLINLNKEQENLSQSLTGEEENQTDSLHDDTVVFQNNNSERQSIITLIDSSPEDSHSSENYFPGNSSVEQMQLDEEDDEFTDTSEFAGLGQLTCDGDDPGTVQDALNCPDSKQWKEAMSDEYQSFIDNDCWTLTDLPKGRKAIKCKWVFKRKYGLNGEMLKFKARLVAKGYSQKYGIDYDETFSPVVRYSTIRSLLAIAAEKDMEIDHMDVKTAFLNGDLKETIYMEQPEGFQVKGQGNKVYKLNKAIYGLKQASKAWYEKINRVLVEELQFHRSSSEPCVYFKRHKEEMIILALYVDDIFLFSSKNSQEKIKIKKQLMGIFEMKDLGPARHILGMSLEKKNDKFLLNQTTYIKKVLQRFKMSDCKPADTPMEAGVKLVKAEKNDSSMEYRNLIGCLMYVSVCTRPDISHAVSILSQFNDCHDDTHWKAAKRVLRYLKGTLNYSLIYARSSLQISCYVDADWAASEVDRRSYTGFVFFIGNCVVSWESRKQRTIALSSTEAEYMALSDACKEALFVRKLLIEFFGKCYITMYNDSQSAQKLCNSSMFHSRTKHIDVRHHFVREVVSNNIVNLKYLSTEQMTADIFTKPLTKLKHYKFVKNLQLNL